MNINIIKSWSNASLILLLILITKSSFAADANWHAESKTYQAYLGIVPVISIKKQPYLIDHDRKLHGGADTQNYSAQHIMVSVFNKKDNKRILNATVIAKVKNKKLIGGNKLIKPLEKMVTSGSITYGNFFDLPDKGEYDIEISVYETNKNGAEELEFVFKKT